MDLAKLAYDSWRLGMLVAGADDLPEWEAVADAETVPWYSVAEEYEMAMAERDQSSAPASFEFVLSRPLPGLKNLPGRKSGAAKFPTPPTKFKVRRPTAAEFFSSCEYDGDRRERLMLECMAPLDGTLWNWDKFIEMELVDLVRLQLQIGATWPGLDQRLYQRWRAAIAEIEALDLAAEIHPADVEAWTVLEMSRPDPRASVLAVLNARAQEVADEDCPRLDDDERAQWPEVATWAGSNDSIRSVWQAITASLAVHDGSFHPITPGAAALTPKHPTRMKDALEGRKVARMGVDAQLVAIALSRCGISMTTIGGWLGEDAERLIHAAFRWQTGSPEGNAERETTSTASSSGSAI